MAMNRFIVNGRIDVEAMRKACLALEGSAEGTPEHDEFLRLREAIFLIVTPESYYETLMYKNHPLFKLINTNTWVPKHKKL